MRECKPAFKCTNASIWGGTKYSERQSESNCRNREKKAACFEEGLTGVNDGREKRKEEPALHFGWQKEKNQSSTVSRNWGKDHNWPAVRGNSFFCSANSKFRSGYQHCHLVIKGFNTKRNPKSAIAQPLACRRLWKMFSASFSFPFQGCCCCCVFPLMSKSGHLYPDMILNASFTFSSHSAYHTFRTFPCSSTACPCN